MNPRYPISTPVVVNTSAQKPIREESHGSSSAKELTRKALILGMLAFLLMLSIIVFGHLLVDFTQTYYGREGVRVLGTWVGRGVAVAVAVGAIILIQHLNMWQLLKVHSKTIDGIVHHQRWDDMGEIARINAMGGSQSDRVMTTAIRAIADANQSARQQSQEMVRHARYLTDNQHKQESDDIQAFLAKLDNMPSVNVTDLS